MSKDVESRAIADKMRAMKAQERAAFIERCCGGNRRLRKEVESLLRDDEYWEQEAKRAQDSTDDLEAGQGKGSGPANGPTGRSSLDHKGLEIGPYVIEGIIAEGGSSTVYCARQAHPSRQVALKVLRRGEMDEPSRRRFEREAQTLAKLDHEGIAHLYTFGITKGPVPRMYMAMELVQGEPITTYSWRHGLDVPSRLKLLVQACEAADYGHRRGIVHRDIKPANILVSSGRQAAGTNGTPEGMGGGGGVGGGAKERVRLIDYGIAIRAGDTLRTTTFGFMVGTLAYMSPEQICQDPEFLDARTDVYSLGVVLYELCCGKVPFASSLGTPMEMLRRISDEDPAKLGTVNPVLRGDLEVIAAKALARDVTMRYQTASELAEDLKRYIEKRPIRARTPSVGYYLSTFVKRNRALSCALVGLGIMGVVAAGMAVRDSIDSRMEARAAAQDAEFWQELLETMWRVPGSHAVRREILGKAIPYLENKVHQRPGDVAITMALARAYQTSSDVDLEQGAYVECYNMRLRAYEILYMVSRESNQPTGWVRERQLARELARATILLGDVVKQMGEEATMFSHYLDALKIHESLLEQHPDDEGVADDLYWSYQRLADQYYECGDLSRATEMMKKQLQTAERNYEQWPESPRIKYSLANALIIELHWKGIEIDPMYEQVSTALELAWPLAFAVDASKQHVSFFVKLASRAARSAVLRGELIESSALIQACDSLRLRGPSPGQEPALDEALMHSLHAKAAFLEHRGDRQGAIDALRLSYPYAQAIDAGSAPAKRKSAYLTHYVEAELARMRGN